MNKLLLLIFATMIAFVATLTAQGPKPAEVRIEKTLEQRNFITIPDSLLNIISWLESKHGLEQEGDNGKAIGNYMIWETYILEHNRVYGTNYTHDDAKCPYTSRMITKNMLIAMGKNFYKNEKRMPTIEDYLAMHNGSYEGYKKQTRFAYIRRYYSECVERRLHL